MKRFITAMLALTVTACAGGTANPGPTATSSFAAGFNSASYTTVNPAEERSGTLRVGISRRCGVLVGQLRSPYRLNQEGTCRNLQRFLVRGLTAFAPYPGASGMEAVPDLATDLGAVSADGFTVTYQLRSGVSWQDGTPITGEDVVFGLKQFDADTPQIAFRDVTATAGTITINLAQPVPTIDEWLAMSAAAPLPSSGAALASGPFMLTGSTRGSYTFAPNPAWSSETDPVRTPHSNDVVVVVNEDREALQNAAISGELDVILEPGMDDVEAQRVLANPSTAGDVDNPATGEVTMLAMQEDVAPLENVACRRAVFSAVDRNAIVSVTGGTLRRLPAITVSPPNYPSYAGGYEPYPIGEGDGDVNAARTQLATCQQPNGFTMRIAYPSSSAEIFNAIRLSLARASITAIGVPIDDALFTGFATTPSELDAAGVGAVLMSYTSKMPSVAAFLGPLVAPVTETQNTNIARIELRSVDVLVDSAELGSRDLAIQGDVGRAIDRLLLDSVAYVPLTYELALHYRKRSLTNVSVSSAFSSEYDAVTLGTSGSPATAAASD